MPTSAPAERDLGESHPPLSHPIPFASAPPGDAAQPAGSSGDRGALGAGAGEGGGRRGPRPPAAPGAAPPPGWGPGGADKAAQRGR